MESPETVVSVSHWEGRLVLEASLCLLCLTAEAGSMDHLIEKKMLTDLASPNPTTGASRKLPKEVELANSPC